MIANKLPSLVIHSVRISMYSVYMSILMQIRSVPEPTRRELKARAAARGLSLNSYLLELLEQEVAQPTVADVLQRATRRSERATVSALEAVAAERGQREERFGPGTTR